MKIDAFIEEYEKMAGKTASDVVRHFVEGLINIGESFQAKGREDGVKGLLAPGADAFVHWANKVFDDDPELAVNMAELMQMAYMDGYREGGAA